MSVSTVNQAGESYYDTIVRSCSHTESTIDLTWWYRGLVTSGTSPLVFLTSFKPLMTSRRALNSFWYVFRDSFRFATLNLALGLQVFDDGDFSEDSTFSVGRNDLPLSRLSN